MAFKKVPQKQHFNQPESLSGKFMEAYHVFE
jgi:hypothetical protein